MEIFQKKRSRKTGLPPGSLVHIGDQKVEDPGISIIRYGADILEQEDFKAWDSRLEEQIGKQPVTWINIDGLHDTALMQRIGEVFGIHPLVLEDIVNTEQRPKFEDFEAFLFMVMKMHFPGKKPGVFHSEQVSLVLGKDFVITFQEKPGDVFDPVRERIRKGKGRIRKMGADYLAYALLDVLVDQFFVILEEMAEAIEEVEEIVLKSPEQGAAHRIHHLKRNLLQIRRSVWPLREMVNNLEKTESPLLTKTTRVFLRDVYDHTIQLIDNVEVSREITSGLLEVHLSSLSNRTNQVMKVLTIVATLFIPLTFVVGVYGMNFDYMPELHWKWGYPAVMLLMLFAVSGMLWYFRKKRWL